MTLIVDLFAGGGGASAGLEAALGRPVDLAINHDPIALAVHKANHSRTHHLEADVWEVRPEEAVKGRPVAILWASPDCTHFSVAKGAKPRAQNIRSLAWVVVRWAKAVRPDVLFLENVSEFKGWGPLDKNGLPIKARMGETFTRWRRALERLGYVVDWRVLDASLYGAPTKRRRLFLVARRDGLPIVWPEFTHGPGKLPLRTAAECIDWSLPCPSIFERKKPLADKTLRRIALGVKRFVIDNPRPFLVRYNRTGGLVDLAEPLPTVMSKDKMALLSPTLIQTGYGEDTKRNGGRGQAPRVPGLNKPLGTLVAGGQKHALVSAFLAKHFGGVVGIPIDQPASTITAVDHHGLAAATLVKFRGTSKVGAPVDGPMPTLTGGGTHIAEVRAFLMSYYTSGSVGQNLELPLRTITGKDRLGLVTIEGTDYQIVDIGMRMLQPHELLRAQFGRFSYDYDLSAAHTKKDKVRLIGNSVCPEVAEAVTESNPLVSVEAVS